MEHAPPSLVRNVAVAFFSAANGLEIVLEI